jgi:hypothetical protein
MITVTFSPESERQVAALAQAMMAYLGATAEAPPVEDEAPKAPRKTKKAEAPAVETPAPAVEAPAPAVEAPAPAVEAPAVTLEQVRAKLTELSQNGKAADVKTLIAKFGGAKLTDIKPGNYADIMKAAEVL